MGRVVHFEIPAADLDRAERFYTAVFGWKVLAFGNQDHRLLITGDEGEPGIAETERAVVAAGGKQVRDRASIPGIGQVSYFTDTEGNLFNAMQGLRSD